MPDGGQFLALIEALDDEEAGGGLAPSFFAPLLTTLVPTTALGSAVPTYVRATAAYMVDWESAIRACVIGEARFLAARRVQNLVLASQTPGAASWGAISGGTKTARAGVGPNGEDAAEIGFGGLGGSGMRASCSGAPTASDIATISFLARTVGGGTTTVRTECNGIVGGATAVTVTGAWQRVTAIGVACTAGSMVLDIVNNAGNNSLDIQITDLQLEIVTNQSNQNPGEYVSVAILAAPFQGAGVDGVQNFATQNGNTVVANVVTAGVGAALTPLGYLQEQQSTNRCLQSENFGTTWAAIGTPARTAANTRCGSVVLDLLKDADAATLDGYSQVITFVGFNSKDISFHFSKDTSASSAIRLRDTSLVQDRILAVITWAGAVPTITMTTGTLLGIDTLANGVFRARLLSTIVTAGNVNQLEFYPATDAALSVGGTGNINIGGVQAEDNLPFCTSYIPTKTTAVTRNIDSLTYVGAGNFSSAAGTVACEVTTPGAGGVNMVFVGTDGGCRIPWYNGAGTVQIFDSTNNSGNIAWAPVAGPTKMAAKWSGALMTAYVAGVAGAPGTFDGNMNITTNIPIGQNSGGSFALNGCVRNVKIFTSALTDAQVAAL